MPSVRMRDETDIAIIGNGPAALALSYILSGHRPVYCGRHPDPLLHGAFKTRPDLLNVDPAVYDRLAGSLAYSTSALPANTLLDTLIRPRGDVGGSDETCVDWVADTSCAIDHLVVGRAATPGGQWADASSATDWDLQSLSYNDQLSLPGFTIEQHWREKHGCGPSEYERPPRRAIADYYAAYPKAVGIAGRIRCGETIETVVRLDDGFLIEPQGIVCRQIVLATGVSDVVLPPPRLIAPLSTCAPTGKGTVLIIGSGFTAADAIMTTPSDQSIVHLYKWDPRRPSPLKACHSSAYPEYAWIHRQMRSAATSKKQRQSTAPSSVMADFAARDWNQGYRGVANGTIMSVEAAQIPHESDSSSSCRPTRVIVQDWHGATHIFTVSQLIYAAGRRGSLAYLDDGLRRQVLAGTKSRPGTREPDCSRDGSVSPVSAESPASPVTTKKADESATGMCNADAERGRRPAKEVENGSSGMDALEKISSHVDSHGLAGVVGPRTLRAKMEAAERAIAAEAEAQAKPATADAQVLTSPFEVAPGAYAIGSLAGDSLVRFAIGSCCSVAGALVAAKWRGWPSLAN